MSNVLGKNITFTIFGESHGEVIGGVLDGVAPGIKIDMDFIRQELSRRMPTDGIGTDRREEDEVHFLSGIYEGTTTGDSIAFTIDNKDVSNDGADHMRLPRPGHADYANLVRSSGYMNPFSGGHLSGRLTAPIVVAGAILKPALGISDIKITSKVSEIAGICGNEDIMKEAVLSAKNAKDSVGGIISTTIEGIPAGVGEPFFDSIESKLSSAIFSIPGIKGIEFGLGFEMAKLFGSQTNDEFAILDEKVITKTNHNGGINGGITNGMPITFNCVIKPTPSIGKKQQSVDLEKMEEAELEINTRNDACIAFRAPVIIEAISALTIADILVTRFGRDYLLGE